MMPYGTENTNGQSSCIIQDFLNTLYFGRMYTGPQLDRVSNIANPFTVKAPHFLNKIRHTLVSGLSTI